jgi:hypothetical protein
VHVWCIYICTLCSIVIAFSHTLEHHHSYSSSTPPCYLHTHTHIYIYIKHGLHWNVIVAELVSCNVGFYVTKVITDVLDSDICTSCPSGFLFLQSYSLSHTHTHCCLTFPLLSSSFFKRCQMRGRGYIPLSRHGLLAG